MNIGQYGYIISQAQKASWEDSDFTTFVWNLGKLLDDNPDEWDLQEYEIEVKFPRKDGKDESQNTKKEEGLAESKS